MPERKQTDPDQHTFSVEIKLSYFIFRFCDFPKESNNNIKKRTILFKQNWKKRKEIIVTTKDSIMEVRTVR